MLTTFFKKKRKGEHISHKSKFGKVFGRAGRPFSKMDIFKNVQNRFVKIQFEKKNQSFFSLFLFGSLTLRKVRQI